MIFGDIFYKNLNKLKDKQQSLFALCLAQRAFINFQLYCDCIEDATLKNIYQNVLNDVWKWHLGDKKIDLEHCLSIVDNHMPSVEEDSMYGVYPALDFTLLLSLAITAILQKGGDEAENASNLSVGTVVKFLEMREDKEIDEEEIYDYDLVNNEIEFQVNLSKDVKFTDKILELRKDIEEIGVSNIGIEVN